MHEEPQMLLRQAILNSLPHARQLEGQFLESYVVWRRLGDTGWKTEQQSRPNIAKILNCAGTTIDETIAEFCNAFRNRHPECTGSIGLFRQHQIWEAVLPRVVRNAMDFLWHRHRTFTLTESQVDTVVEEFARFVDNRTVRVRFQAILINCDMPDDPLHLPEMLTIRRLSEMEFSEIYEESLNLCKVFRSQSTGLDTVVLEGEGEEPVLFGGSDSSKGTATEHAKRVFDKAILCLRTFKPGHIGYDRIRLRPAVFCPIGFFSDLCGSEEYIPFGRYAIVAADYGPLVSHAGLIFNVSNPAMEAACLRLADAENRTRSQDKIVDAVIGMEALLLAGKQQNELSFRFSLNYAMLFPKTEREMAFRVARDLYGLRSTIAHGTPTKDVASIAGRKMPLAEAGRQATDSLRMVLKCFLSEQEAPYDDKTWQRMYFGL